jgi:hypothetical protein
VSTRLPKPESLFDSSERLTTVRRSECASDIREWSAQRFVGRSNQRRDDRWHKGPWRKLWSVRACVKKASRSAVAARSAPGPTACAPDNAAICRSSHPTWCSAVYCRHAAEC